MRRPRVTMKVLRGAVIRGPSSSMVTFLLPAGASSVIPLARKSCMKKPMPRAPATSPRPPLRWASCCWRAARDRRVPVEADPGRALYLLTEGYDSGERRAAASLGKAYDQGLGTTRDIDRAIEYYNEAASTNVTAARRLAYLLTEVEAPKARITAAANKAVSQLEARAEKGNNRSYLVLADIFMRNEIMDPDPERALGYLEKLDAADDPGVLLRFAKLYGDLGDDTEEEAMLRKAADLGDKRAQTKLAGVFLKAGTPKTNGSVGRYYAERAIAQGSESAMIYLGSALVKGDVLEPDPEIGEVLLRRVSNAGNTGGKAALGIALLREQIPERFPGERLELLETAADEGSTAAMSALGFAYHTGRGLQQNDAAALSWLQRAADAGHPRAKRFLRERLGA